MNTATASRVLRFNRPARRRRSDGQHQLTISSTYAAARTQDGRVPFLRVRGQWLAQFGFERGARVLIAAEQGRLVVTLAPPDMMTDELRPSVILRRPRKARPYLAARAALRAKRGVPHELPAVSLRVSDRGCDRPAGDDE